MIYEYEEGKYRKVGEVEMKDIVTRKWVPAIIYRSVYRSPEKIYVREKLDFEKKFKVVIED